MSTRQHLDRAVLRQLLASPETFDDERVHEHFRDCLQCQRELDRIAASAETWQKAKSYLSEASPQNTDSSGFCPPSPFVIDPPAHPELLGRLGKFDIEREVGRGGMGIVYKAYDSELHRPVAIKLLSDFLSHQEMARRRFAKEAIAAAGVIHPNVIAIHGVDQQNDVPYIVMSFVDGHSLQQLIDQKGPLPELELVRIALQIAAGLQAAHCQGLVHRDVKPANILVEANVNRVVITDFGLAQAEDDTSLTKTGWLAGTPNYMSPEQARGVTPDQRSDLFSLGSVLYFLATGQVPFRAEASLAVLEQIRNEVPVPVRRLNPKISPSLEQVIARLLEKDPADRFQSAAELHEFLESLLVHLNQPENATAPTLPPSVSHRAVQSARRRSRLLFAGCLGLAVIAGAIVLNAFKKESSDVTPAFRFDLIDAVSPKLRAASDSPTRLPAIEPGRRLLRSGESDLLLGKYESASVSLSDATRYPWCSGAAHFLLACLCSAQDDQPLALQHLELAIQHGFTETTAFDSPLLKPLRSNPGFQDVIQRAGPIQRAFLLVDKKIEDVPESEVRGAEMILESLAKNERNEEAIVSLGYLIHLQGDRLEEARVWHERAMRTTKYAALGHYNLCCYFAKKQLVHQALDELERAMEKGLDRLLRVSVVEQDLDLSPLYGEPRFQDLLNSMRSRSRL